MTNFLGISPNFFMAPQNPFFFNFLLRSSKAWPNQNPFCQAWTGLVWPEPYMMANAQFVMLFIHFKEQRQKSY